MGAQNSTQKKVPVFEAPSKSHTATLYYFAGRGKADQIRWMLAATNVNFTQKVVDSRAMFVNMAERQLPFGQLPLLQIDGNEIVQSQAAIRYLARRGKLVGQTSEDELKCDMIAESINDLLGPCVSAPFKRAHGSAEAAAAHVADMKKKWAFLAARYEAVLKMGPSKDFLVGESLTYADVLMAHATTWYIEECGPEIVEDFPYLVALQIRVISMSGLDAFIKSRNFYSVGDAVYCTQVETVLGRICG